MLGLVTGLGGIALAKVVPEEPYPGYIISGAGIVLGGVGIIIRESASGKLKSLKVEGEQKFYLNEKRKV